MQARPCVSGAPFCIYPNCYYSKSCVGTCSLSPTLHGRRGGPSTLMVCSGSRVGFSDMGLPDAELYCQGLGGCRLCSSCSISHHLSEDSCPLLTTYQCAGLCPWFTYRFLIPWVFQAATPHCRPQPFHRYCLLLDCTTCLLLLDTQLTSWGKT